MEQLRDVGQRCSITGIATPQRERHCLLHLKQQQQYVVHISMQIQTNIGLNEAENARYASQVACSSVSQ